MKTAEAIVRFNLARSPEIAATLPENLPAEKKEELLRARVEQVIASDNSEFRTAVALSQKQLDNEFMDRYSKEYLRDADCYYYLSLTKNVLEKGALGPAREDGTFYNPLRCAPNGAWDLQTWHPYVGAAAYRLLRTFDKKISLTRAAAYVPVLLTLLITAGILFLLFALGTDFSIIWLGATVFLLLPAVILRSNYGWYDTDPYILFFSSVILGSLLWAIRTPRKAVWFGLAGGTFAGLFAMFWQGWIYMVALVGAGSLVLIVFEHFKKDKNKGQHVKYLLGYGVILTLYCLTLASSRAMGQTFSSNLSFFLKIGKVGEDFLPTLLRTINETNPPSAADWFFLIGPGMLFCSALGLLAAGANFLKKKNEVRFRLWLITTFVCLPPLILSMQGKRYIFILTPWLIPLSVFGMEWFRNFLREKALIRLPEKFRGAVAFLLLTLCVLPVSLVNARTANEQFTGLMDKRWFKVLTFLKTKTPKNAIVFSSWSPGYLINGIAERRSVMDGGTQACIENFWIARALMSRDERQAAGIFRMLAGSGNQALEYLKICGTETDAAVELIMKIVPLDRDRAESELPASWPSSQKDSLLNYTHSKKIKSPVYLLIYPEMIDDNAIVQQASRWNFKKAKKAFDRPMAEILLRNFGEDQNLNYFKQVNAITGGTLPYQKPRPFLYSVMDYLVYQDLIIDRTQKNAFMIEREKTGLDLQPISLIYPQDGTWVRKPVSDSPSAVWATSFDMNNPEGSRKAMLVPRELLDSVLFQLYYFNGKNYRSIRPFISEGSLNDANYVQVFRVNFPGDGEKGGARLSQK
ncbi:MAG TPA: STT3 domain-containing protein [Candidatus Omnitrophota bacterium]|nr:STT3 domain-containing protein [Candidatus Omnitrophota bacterium]